ncbi:MAG: hypothetical protein JXQ73_00160 [Phycisphaerae bacterium]|nr:hypothetical protein [Phycisphaerae bacterium]
MTNPLAGLSEEDLLREFGPAARTILKRIGSGLEELHEFGLAMERNRRELAHLSARQSPAVPKGLWGAVCEQVHELLCTRSARYRNLRTELSKKAKPLVPTIVGMISAGVGAQSGFAVGAVVPFVALCLLAILRVGKEAWCAYYGRLLEQGHCQAGRDCSGNPTAARSV